MSQRKFEEVEMKTVVGRIAVVAMALGLIGSSCVTALPHLSEGQLTWAHQKWPEMQTAELEHGRTLYVARCGSCHALPDPTEKTTKLEADMIRRSHLEGADLVVVQRYLDVVQSDAGSALANAHADASHPTAAAQ